MIETKKISIKTLSPIHIKGKEFSYGEGFVRRDDSSAYTLDLGKLFGFILDNIPGGDKLLLQYNNAIEKAIKENKIKEFDNEKYLADNNIYYYKNNKTLEKKLIKSGAFSSIVHITGNNGFIKDGIGRAYIPGSSIKGTIRTAILYNAIEYYFTNNINNEATQIINNITNHLDNLSNNLNKAKSEREQQKLKKDFLRELELKVLQTNIPHTTKDFLRCIIIKDSQFLTELQKKEVFVTTAKQSFSNFSTLQTNKSIGEIILMLEKPMIMVKDTLLNISKKMKQDKINLLIKNEGKCIIIKDFDREFIVDFDLVESNNINYSLTIKTDDYNNETKETIEIFEGETIVEISINKQIYNSLVGNYPFVNFNSVDGLLNTVYNFYHNVWKVEKDFFDIVNDDNLNCELLRTFYNSDINNLLRVGWGSGLPAVSMFLLFDEKVQKYLRNTVFEDKKDLLATKSRRLIFENNKPAFPLGWLKFSEV